MFGTGKKFTAEGCKCVCGNEEYVEGPKGTLMTNICCTNCYQAYNVCFGMDFYKGCDPSKWYKISNKYFTETLNIQR